MKKKLLIIMLVVATVVSLFCFPVRANETTPYGGKYYYIDPEKGLNSNDGLSIDKPKKTINLAVTTRLRAGDIVLIKRGTTVMTNGIILTNSGEKNKPITITAYGDETKPLPIICANNFSMTAVIYVKNQSYITIDSINIKSNITDSTNTISGVKFESSGGNTCYGSVIKNCVIEGYAGEDWTTIESKNFTGITVAAAKYDGFYDGVTIENNEIYDCKALGISVNGTYGGCDLNAQVNEKSAKNVVVRNNFLYNIGKDGILVNNCNSPLVEYNVCGKSHSYAMDTWHVAIWPFACYNALFQFNEAYDTMTTYDGQGFDCDYQCYYTTFQYNYSHDNTGGFMLICTEPLTWDKKTAFNVGVTVRYNISQNDKHNLFCLTCHIKDTKIYNNTIYADKGVDQVFYVYSRDGEKMPLNTKIYNNIFYTNTGKFTWQKSQNTEFKNNLIYGKNSDDYPKNDAAETSDDGIESVGNIHNDPMLANPGGARKGIDTCYVYKLLKGSPAIGRGLIIDDETNTRDFFNNPVSQTKSPNIGAYNGDGIVFKKGDADFDGEVNIRDSLRVMYYLVNAYDKSMINVDYVDYNGDGIITLTDLLYLKKQLAEQ